jgi:hypothetical protein
MKYIYILLAISLMSCNTRKDYFEGINKSPTLTLIREGSSILSITDSAKINYPYKVSYILNDEENLKLNIKQLQGNDSIAIQDSTIYITPLKTGSSKFDISAMDSYQKSAVTRISLTVFDNLNPVCSFKINPVQTLSLFEIEIDASGSYDPDSKWGGKIVNYEYTLENQDPVVLTTPSMRYIFSSSGVKNIVVRVQDNNNAWSDPRTVYYTLQ